MRHIAVVNQKGGVGKTTITANLGHALSLCGNRVVVVDLDPQGQLSASLGLFKAPSHGIDEVMLGEATLYSASLSTREEMLLVPAGNRLGEIERLQGGMERAELLKAGVERGAEKYDYVLYDLPPSSGLIMANAVMVADEIVAPVTGDYLGLNGVAHLMKTVKQFDKIREQPLIKWVVMSRMNPRRRLSKEVTEKLSAYFKDQILATPIVESAVLAECPGVGRTVFEYRPKSRSAKDFAELAQDLILKRTL